MFFKTRYFVVHFQLIAFVHILLPECWAKGITDVPLCSLSCVTREAVDLRCLLTDTGCLCSKPTFITGTVTCAQSRCKRPDLSTANEVLTEMCAAGPISSSSWSLSSTSSSSTTSELKSTLTPTSSSSSTLTPPPRASTTGSPESDPSTTVVVATVFDPPSSLGMRTRGNLWGGIGPAVIVVLGLGLKIWI